MAFWGAVVGGAVSLLSDSGSDGQQIQERKIDPQIAKYIYGQNGGTGLLGAVDNRYQGLLANGGMTPYQSAGLEMQRQSLLSPQTTGVWDAQRSAGMGLLGAGAAGNPFQTGNVQRNGRVNVGANNAVPMPMQRAQFDPSTFAAAYQPVQQVQALEYQQPHIPDVDALVQAAIAQQMAAQNKPELWNGG